MEGKIVPKDCPRAMECFELGLEDPNAIGCANLAGKLLYLGQDGASSSALALLIRSSVLASSAESVIPSLFSNAIPHKGKFPFCPCPLSASGAGAYRANAAVHL